MRDTLHDPEFDPWPDPTAGTKPALPKKTLDAERPASGNELVSACFFLGGLCFVGLVWILTTLAVVVLARHVGWPGCLGDAGVLALAPVSLLMTVLLIIAGPGIPALVLTRWRAILDHFSAECPECGAVTRPGPLRRLGLLLAVMVSALGLPGALLGLLVLLFLQATSGLIRPVECVHCGYREE